MVASDDDTMLHRMLSILSNRDLSACARVSKKFCTVARKCTVNDSRAIHWACENGAVEAVRYLLEDGRADPTSDENMALGKGWTSKETDGLTDEIYFHSFTIQLHVQSVEEVSNEA